MKKIITIAAATMVTASAAAAGSVAFVAPQVAMMEEPAMMGGSGAWLIPLVIIAVLALALTTSTEEVPIEVPM